MAKEKHYIFSARTTEEGLRQLSEVKNRLKLSWDELVIDAVCEKYGLEKATMVLPKKEKSAKDNGKAEKIIAEPPVPEDKADGKAKNQGGKKSNRRTELNWRAKGGV